MCMECETRQVWCPVLCLVLTGHSKYEMPGRGRVNRVAFRGCAEAFLVYGQDGVDEMGRFLEWYATFPAQRGAIVTRV